MKVIVNTLISISLCASFGFASTINKGPVYVKNKHYSVGKDNRGTSRDYDKDYKIRLWAISNFGKSFNIKKVSLDTSRKATKLKKTHYANNWYWQSIKNDEYLMLGYSNASNGEYSEALAKRVDNHWFYTCNGEAWYKLEEGEASSCSARVGYDTIKFQFNNPIDGKNWSSNDIVYRFIIKDR